MAGLQDYVNTDAERERLATASQEMPQHQPPDSDPPTEALKHTIIMNYGYNEKQESPDPDNTTPVRIEAASESSSASASKKSTAANSTNSALVKQRIGKVTELQRRHRDTDRPAGRDLMNDFEMKK